MPSSVFHGPCKNLVHRQNIHTHKSSNQTEPVHPPSPSANPSSLLSFSPGPAPSNTPHTQFTWFSVSLQLWGLNVATVSQVLGAKPGFWQCSLFGGMTISEFTYSVHRLGWLGSSKGLSSTALAGHLNLRRYFTQFFQPESECITGLVR